MAIASHGLLTLEQFHQQYDNKKPYFEFRRGEAIQKSMPTWLHNLLERVLVELLERAGYCAGHEIELRVAGDWRPIPDVVAHPEIEQPYPTQPVDVVIEILSPTDRMSEMLEKCADYERIGIGAIFVLDPEQRKGWRWLFGNLAGISKLELPNKARIDLSTAWAELDARLNKSPSKANLG